MRMTELSKDLNAKKTQADERANSTVRQTYLIGRFEPQSGEAQTSKGAAFDQDRSAKLLALFKERDALAEVLNCKPDKLVETAKALMCKAVNTKQACLDCGKPTGPPQTLYVCPNCAEDRR